MVDKRFKHKLDILRKDSIKPDLVGGTSYNTLIVGWGSNYYCIYEALRNIVNNDVSMLYFKQLYPINPSILNYLEKADQVLSIENNAGGQFSKLILAETGFKINNGNMLLKYDGLPFPTETVQKFIEEKIEGVLQ